MFLTERPQFVAGILHFQVVGHHRVQGTSVLEGRCRAIRHLQLTQRLPEATKAILILRTYALWNRSEIVLAVILTAFFAVLVTLLIVTFSTSATATFNTSVNPAITGYYQYSVSIDRSVPFLLLIVLELGVVVLTLIRAIVYWRINRNPLYIVLLKHNIFYYACGLFFSAINALTSLFLHTQYAYQGMFQDTRSFQIVILAILATHMHLHLWHADRQLHSSDAFMPIPLSDMSSGGCTA
ncbi:hypothetical protein M405DRAFT_821254 [Rhizopogon salebrosus TDB-379]|nr:hypothetical protein M405DRAFT_821254 [Rhizopogon salebrosus TDB-379]